MTISIQRWLAVRLDLIANVLILGIALFAAGFRHTINPAKVGVVLSYALSSTYLHPIFDASMRLTSFRPPFSNSDVLWVVFLISSLRS